MTNRLSTVLFLGYSLVFSLLFFYSFTQIDANMTVSRVGWVQSVQNVFRTVGMSQRPLSTAMYLSILLLLFFLYGFLLRSVRNGSVKEKDVWRIVWLSVGILFLSYPAFSYDMFNYMFTAKTVLVYRQNPYEVIPLQFAGIDPWTNFMRWTHLPSAYTPLWITLTLPAYLLGFGLLLPTMWSIKLLVIIFHIATTVGIGKILQKIQPEKTALGIAIFALNPLIIIENLVSGHNDVVMMALAVWAVVFLLSRNIWWSWVILASSVGLKLMTALLFPVWLFIKNRGTKSDRWAGTDWRMWMLILMVLGLLAVIATREILPWYWVWIMPFVALIPSVGHIVFFAASVSLGLLLRYVPYLYHGHYDYPVREVRFWVSIIPVVVAGLVVLFWRKRRV